MIKEHDGLVLQTPFLHSDRQLSSKYWHQLVVLAIRISILNFILLVASSFTIERTRTLFHSYAVQVYYLEAHKQKGSYICIYFYIFGYCEEAMLPKKQECIVW